MPIGKYIIGEGSGNQDDAYVGATSTSNYLTARNRYTGTSRLDSASSSVNGIWCVKAPGRGGGYNWYNFRSLFSFDLLGEESRQISEAVVKIKLQRFSGSGTNYEKTCLVMMLEEMNGNTGDYDGMLDGSDDMILISDIIDVPPVSASVQEYTINSTGISEINKITCDTISPVGSNRYFEVALVSYTYDYLKTDPGSDSLRARVYYQEEGGGDTPRLGIGYADYATTSLGINF